MASETNQHLIGYYLLTITTFHLGIFWLLYWRSIIRGIKGNDGVFQIIEIAGYMCLVVWPSMLLADAFFGFRASDHAWQSIDLVIIVAVLGISYNKYLVHKTNIEEKKIEGSVEEKKIEEGVETKEP